MCEISIVAVPSEFTIENVAIYQTLPVISVTYTSAIVAAVFLNFMVTVPFAGFGCIR
jgi:hypothetical protein